MLPYQFATLRLEPGGDDGARSTRSTDLEVEPVSMNRVMKGIRDATHRLRGNAWATPGASPNAFFERPVAERIGAVRLGVKEGHL